MYSLFFPGNGNALIAADLGSIGSDSGTTVTRH